MSDAYAITEPGGIYFMTFTVIGWVDVFTRERYRTIVTESLSYCRANKQLSIHGWVLMSNHLHLIASVPHDINMADVVRDFKKHTARRIVESLQNESGESRREWMLNLFAFAGKNNRDNTNFQFWRNDNRGVVIYSQAVFLEKLNYIHQNPVRSGIVRNAVDYVYSSADVYAGQKGVIEIDPVIPKVFVK